MCSNYHLVSTSLSFLRTELLPSISVSPGVIWLQGTDTGPRGCHGLSPVGGAPGPPVRTPPRGRVLHGLPAHGLSCLLLTSLFFAVLTSFLFWRI